MGYYYASINGHVFSGINTEMSQLPVSIPINYLSEEQKNMHNTNTAFSLMLTMLDPEGSLPFRVYMVMPELYVYSELTQEEYRRQVLNRPFHQHNTYELVYVREGEFYQQIENTRHKYSQRSCCLLNRNIRHREEYTTAFSIVNLSLSYDFLKKLLEGESEHFFMQEPLLHNQSELFQFFSNEFLGHQNQRKSYIDFIPLDHIIEGKDYIHDLLDHLTQIIISPVPGGSYIIRGLICQILYHLSDCRSYTTTPINLGSKTESRLFSQITARMEETNGRISRDTLSHELNYSGNYLNRIVNKYTGMNLFQYGTSIAMQRAAWLLIHTEMPITEIITELGFTDRTHFYQLFRKQFEETPKQFRIKHR